MTRRKVAVLVASLALVAPAYAALPAQADDETSGARERAQWAVEATQGPDFASSEYRRSTVGASPSSGEPAVWVPDRLGGSHRVQITHGSVPVGLGIETSTTNRVAERGGAAVYHSDREDVSFVVDAHHSGARIVAILNNRAARHDVTFTVDGPQELALELEGDGTVSVLARVDDEESGLAVDPRGDFDESIAEARSDERQVVGYFEAPWAVDAEGKHVATSYEVVEGELIQVVVPDRATVYPVAADPTYAAIASPTGCYGKTDNPHKSGSFASVHARTRCPNQVYPMIVSLNLQRGRWYGWENLAHNARERTTTGVETVAKWYCAGQPTDTYRGFTYHRATVGGNAAIAYTSNDNQFSC